MALHGKLTVDDLGNADLPYAPPFSLAIDHLIVTAHVLENKMTGRMTGISVTEVKDRVAPGADRLILDTRGPAEFEEMRLGIGETLIPLGALRKRLDDLPPTSTRRSSSTARSRCAATRRPRYSKARAGPTSR